MVGDVAMVAEEGVDMCGFALEFREEEEVVL